MVAGSAAAEAVAIARRNPGLAVGLHVVLVEGFSVLPAGDVGALVDPRTGAFNADMLATAIRLAVSAPARRQMAAEIEAQFRSFGATGLTLDHVNAHKHFHLHPMIGSELLRACLRHGAPGVRAPVEPAAVLRAAGTKVSGFDLAGFFARRFASRARAAGLLVPDQVFGLAWTGAMTAARLVALAPRLPPGFTEIYTHPATADTFVGAAPGYLYRQERDALLAGEVVQAMSSAGISTTGYRSIRLASAPGAA